MLHGSFQRLTFIAPITVENTVIMFAVAIKFRRPADLEPIQVFPVLPEPIIAWGGHYRYSPERQPTQQSHHPKQNRWGGAKASEAAIGPYSPPLMVIRVGRSQRCNAPSRQRVGGCSHEAGELESGGTSISRLLTHHALFLSQVRAALNEPINDQNSRKSIPNVWGGFTNRVAIFIFFFRMEFKILFAGVQTGPEWIYSSSVVLGCELDDLPYLAAILSRDLLLLKSKWSFTPFCNRLEFNMVQRRKGYTTHKCIGLFTRGDEMTSRKKAFRDFRMSHAIPSALLLLLCMLHAILGRIKESNISNVYYLKRCSRQRQHQQGSTRQKHRNARY